MLEMPESTTISRQIDEKIKGRKITEICAMNFPHRFAFFNGDYKEYPLLLTDEIITGAVCHGGMIEISTVKGKLVLSDGAYPLYCENMDKAGKKNQLFVRLDDNSGFTVSIQMYGCIFAFLNGEFENKYYTAAVEKPSPLSDNFTLDYFRSILNSVSGKLSAKAVIATQQRIPGIGNGVSQDILFYAGINPKRPVSSIDDELTKKLYNSIVTVLREMAEKGGRDTERDFYGNKGGYKTLMSKNTLTSPCPKCLGAITKASYLGGTVYYCEHCQPIIK